jgi:hypothetical protein
MTADEGPDSDQALFLPRQHHGGFVRGRLADGRGNHDRMEKRVRLRGPQDKIVPLSFQRRKSRRIDDLSTDVRRAPDRTGPAFQCEGRPRFNTHRNYRIRVIEWPDVLHRWSSSPKA